MNPDSTHQDNNTPQVVVGSGQVVTPQGVVQDVQPAPVATPLVSTAAAHSTAPVAKGQSFGKSGVVKGVFVAVVVAVVFAAGFAANSGVVALNSSNAKSAGKSMVAALTAGNASKAYGLASANLRSQQSAAALMQSVGNVQTTKAKYSDENVQVNGNSAVYVASVDNLPPDDSGKTNGVFVVSMSKHGVGSWKVDDVSVQ